MSAFTWDCMVCKRERPDERIDITYRKLKGAEDQFPRSRVNVRHCNDNPDCVESAATADAWHAAP